MILAYVDPGLGALIWQMAVAAVIGTMFYLKKTRDWIAKTFKKIVRNKNEPADSESQIPPAETEIKAK